MGMNLSTDAADEENAGLAVLLVPLDSFMGLLYLSAH